MIAPPRRGFNLSVSHAALQLGQAQPGLNEGLGEMALHLLSKASFIFQQDASKGHANNKKSCDKTAIRGTGNEK